MLLFYYSYRNLLVRRLTTLLTAGGMGLVIFVFATVLMLAEGFQQTLITSGSPENAVFIRRSAETEVQSIIERRDAAILESFPQVAVDKDAPAGGGARLRRAGAHRRHSTAAPSTPRSTSSGTAPRRRAWAASWSCATSRTSWARSGAWSTLLGAALFRVRVEDGALELASPGDRRLTGIDAATCMQHPVLLTALVSAEERERMLFLYRRLARGEMPVADAPRSASSARTGGRRVLQIRATGRRDTAGACATSTASSAIPCARRTRTPRARRIEQSPPARSPRGRLDGPRARAAPRELAAPPRHPPRAARPPRRAPRQRRPPAGGRRRQSRRPARRPRLGPGGRRRPHPRRASRRSPRRRPWARRSPRCSRRGRDAAPRDVPAGRAARRPSSPPPTPPAPASLRGGRGPPRRRRGRRRQRRRPRARAGAGRRAGLPRPPRLPLRRLGHAAHRRPTAPPSPSGPRPRRARGRLLPRPPAVDGREPRRRNACGEREHLLIEIVGSAPADMADTSVEISSELVNTVPAPGRGRPGLPRRAGAHRRRRRRHRERRRQLLVRAHRGAPPGLTESCAAISRQLGGVHGSLIADSPILSPRLRPAPRRHRRGRDARRDGEQPRQPALEREAHNRVVHTRHVRRHGVELPQDAGATGGAFFTSRRKMS